MCFSCFGCLVTLAFWRAPAGWDTGLQGPGGGCTRWDDGGTEIRMSPAVSLWLSFALEIPVLRLVLSTTSGEDPENQQERIDEDYDFPFRHSGSLIGGCQDSQKSGAIAASTGVINRGLRIVIVNSRIITVMDFLEATLSTTMLIPNLHFTFRSPKDQGQKLQSCLPGRHHDPALSSPCRLWRSGPVRELAPQPRPTERGQGRQDIFEMNFFLSATL